MREVVWFINGWIVPWERRVLLAMAQGLSAKGVTLRTLGLKGTSKEWGYFLLPIGISLQALKNSSGFYMRESYGICGAIRRGGGLSCACGRG